MKDPGLIAMLDTYDPVAVSAYREAVRLSVYYAGSDFSATKRKSDKHQAARWRDAAHRVLREAIENLKQTNG